MCNTHFFVYLYQLLNKTMNKLVNFIWMLVFCLPMQAQYVKEMSDSSDFASSQVKDFGGFILDMGTMLNAESLEVPFTLPSLGYLLPFDETASPYRINKEAYQFSSNINYWGNVGYLPSYSTGLSIFHSAGGTPIQWQGVSYKLKNGIRINTYGEYDADGNKVYNPSALPWQKNNFNAAFEVKSPNGKFGLKVEVHQGRNYAY